MTTRVIFAALTSTVLAVAAAHDASAQSAGLSGGGAPGSSGLSAGRSSGGFSQRGLGQASTRSVQMSPQTRSTSVFFGPKRQPPDPRWQDAESRSQRDTTSPAGLVPAGESQTGEVPPLHPAPTP